MWIDRRYLAFTAFLLLLAGLPAWVSAEEPNSTGTLTVHVRGLESGEGNLRFVIFDSDENFLKHPVHAEIIEIKEQQGTWIIEELPYGTYAVLVHQDINMNGTMERHWYGKPKEPSGVSNDAPAKFGPPKFKNAKFQFDTPTLTITVTVK